MLAGLTQFMIARMVAPSGGLSGMSIINLPQAAVLGMHEIKDKPVVVNGRIVIRPIMVVALTYDHRVMEGRKAATFFGE